MKALASLPKEKLQKVILVIMVTLIGIGVVAALYVGPKISMFSSKKRRLAELKGQLQEAEETIRHEVQNSKAREATKTFVDQQQMKMISGDPFSWVVRELSLLAEQYPVHVTAIRPGGTMASSQKSRYETFTTHIEVEGSYDQLGVFVRSLENEFLTGEVRSLQVVPTDASRAQCRATLEFALLIQLESDQAKPTDKTSQELKKTL